MARLDYECERGHRFEADYGSDHIDCTHPGCDSKAEIIWMSPRSPHRQLQTPIVMWRYEDGSLGVAGGADSRTPKNAERVEIRSIGEYRRYAKEINSQLKGKEDRREERFAEAMENMEKHYRSNLAWAMSQETDPIAKDIYREALERQGGRRRAPNFGEFFSIAMEMDKSNYE